ncbi:hypothetical protein TRVL_03855 [Trypanosoma vivax]|nr:hypothetical protein TRVL_03855 [Trypanosoma vivax]
MSAWRSNGGKAEENSELTMEGVITWTHAAPFLSRWRLVSSVVNDEREDRETRSTPMVWNREWHLSVLRASCEGRRAGGRLAWASELKAENTNVARDDAENEQSVG